MNAYIQSRDELHSVIKQAVEEAVSKRLPKIIRKASKKEIYDITSTCELLNVSRRHLQYLRDSGQLSYVKNGRKIYFRAEDLEEFFDKNYIEADTTS